MTEEKELIPRDYVYIGKRWSSKGKVIMGYQLIKEDGTLEDPPIFWEFDRKMERSIGCVYTGAKFSDITASGGISAMGIASAKFKKAWPNQEDRIQWQNKNDDVEADVRNQKLEKDAGRVSDIERIMLPLRQQYESMRVRRDWAGQEALERAVLRALKISPRKIEEE